VGLGDADRAHLGVPAAAEAVADGQHPAAGAVLGLQHDHLVAVLHQVVGGGQAREAGAEHHDAIAAARARRRRARRGGSIGERDRAGGGDVPQERAAIDRVDRR
jgi:hypothetical protein